MDERDNIGQNNIPTPESQAAAIKIGPIIRTYKSDVEELIQTNHLSSINMAIAENKKMFGKMQDTSVEEKPKKDRTILIISIILVVGGILAIFIPYLIVNYQNRTQVSITQQTTTEETTITPDLAEKINIDNLNIDRLAITLSERVEQSSIRLGTIKSIYLTRGEGVNEQKIGANEFLLLIKAHTPNELLRTIKSAYMFGMYNYNSNQRFLVFKIGSYDTAFSGMLSWEVDLWRDFKDLFSLTGDTDGVETTNTLGIEQKNFEDMTYNNKDARVVKNSSGKVIFLYSIIDKETIVFTTSADTLKEIISRNEKTNNVAQ